MNVELKPEAARWVEAEGGEFTSEEVLSYVDRHLDKVFSDDRR